MKKNIKNFFISYGMIVFFIFLLFYASWLRFYMIGEIPYWMDEARHILAIDAVITRGSTVLQSGVVMVCPLYCYPAAWLTQLFGESAFLLRSIAVVINIVSIIGFFTIIYRFWDKYIAFFSSFFLLFSYWQIAWSRQVGWYTLFLLFFWLAWGVFLYYLSTKKISYLFLSLFFAALSTITHRIGILLVAFYIMWFFIDYFFFSPKKEKFFEALKKLILLVVSLIVFILILYFGMGFSLWKYIGFLDLSNNLSSLGIFLFTEYWFFLLLSAMSICFAYKNKKELKLLLFLLLPFIGMAFFLFFLVERAEYRYIFHTTPGLYIASAYAIVHIWNRMKFRFMKIAQLIIILVVFFVYSHGVLLPQKMYALESDDITASKKSYYQFTPQPYWNKAYEIIALQKEPQDIIISSHPEFTQIFMQESGYWMQYHALKSSRDNILKDREREYYTNAPIIRSLEELQEMVAQYHGFIVFDFSMLANMPPQGFYEYVSTHMKPIFYEETNPHSKVWAFRF